MDRCQECDGKWKEEFEELMNEEKERERRLERGRGL